MNTTHRLGQYSLIAWLALSHLAAAAVAALTIYLTSTAWLPAAILFGLVAGLLLSAPLRVAVELAVLALAQLARGQGAELPRGWQSTWGPLSRVLGLIAILGARERQLTGLRDDLVRSTSQAATQAERNRLARDLHDSIKQQLYGINVNAAAALARWDADLPGARAAVEEVRRAAQAALAEMAALLQQLRPAPLAAAGLLDALREQAEALGHRTGAAVSVDFGPPEAGSAYSAAVDEGRLAPGAEEALYRIAQEALSNIARHARASHVTLSLHVEAESLHLTITDDGQGFDATDATHRGFGLAGMQDRAAAIGAALDINSALGAGTRLNLTFPLAEPAGKEQEKMDAQIKELAEKADKWHAVALGATLLALTIGQRLVLELSTGSIQAAAFVSVALLILFAVGGRIAWSRAQAARLGATLVTGPDHPLAWRLLRETHTRQMWVTLAAVVILPAAWVPMTSPQQPVVGLAVGLACAVLAVVQMALGYRATEGYWRRLTGAARLAEIEQAWSQRFTPLLVLGVTVSGYLWLRFGGAPTLWEWPPSRELMIDILATVYLVLLVAWAVATYVQVRRWRMG